MGFEQNVAPIVDVFEGPSATQKLCNVIADSGLEPQAFAEHFIITHGLQTRGSVAVEFRCLVFGLLSLAVVDRLNLPRLATAEHLSRRWLQLMKAIKRNNKSPDFEGLDGYLLHLGGSQIGVRTPAFDRWIMESQKTEAFIMKQARLVREEEAAKNQQKPPQPQNPPNPGPGKTKKKGDDVQLAPAGPAPG